MWYTLLSTTTEAIMEKRVTKSSTETKLLGEKFGESLQGGESVALYGDLGSGKTTFVQGIAQGLGITRRIVSPTFIILKTYPLAKKKNNIDTFYHADLYRIQGEKDAQSIGLGEILKQNDVVTVIEWPEKIEELLPQKVRKIRFAYLSENERSIIYE
jgi:tRNA threonylcarbamoyladenosine biosynthesis protein TsaE